MIARGTSPNINNPSVELQHNCCALKFEDLLGLKIIFEKCEMILLNISNTEGAQLANILECKLSHLLLLILKSLSSGNSQLNIGIFLLDKLDKKLQKEKIIIPLRKSNSFKFSSFCSIIILNVNL
jgi:hypothetical protein